MSKKPFTERVTQFDDVHETRLPTGIGKDRTQFYLGFNDINTKPSAKLAREYTRLTNLEGEPIEPDDWLREQLEKEGRELG